MAFHIFQQRCSFHFKILENPVKLITVKIIISHIKKKIIILIVVCGATATEKLFISVDENLICQREKEYQQLFNQFHELQSSLKVMQVWARSRSYRIRHIVLTTFFFFPFLFFFLTTHTERNFYFIFSSFLHSSNCCQTVL